VLIAECGLRNSLGGSAVISRHPIGLKALESPVGLIIGSRAVRRSCGHTCVLRRPLSGNCRIYQCRAAAERLWCSRHRIFSCAFMGFYELVKQGSQSLYSTHKSFRLAGVKHRLVDLDECMIRTITRNVERTLRMVPKLCGIANVTKLYPLRSPSPFPLEVTPGWENIAVVFFFDQFMTGQSRWTSPLTQTLCSAGPKRW